MICETMFKLKKNGEPFWNCYCRHPELIENYDKAVSDKTQTWDCHHRKEELYSRKELIERGEYYDVPPEELIFLTRDEHNLLHNRGKKLSEEAKRKMSKAMKGKFINRKDLSKKVLCVETGEIFDSACEAQRRTGIFHSSISAACHGKLKTTGGLHWKFL